jgi:hypothetical protein
MKKNEKQLPKIIARLRDGKLIKGYMKHMPMENVESVFDEAAIALSREIGVTLAGSSETLSIPLESLKALFFVKSFEGSSDYQEVKFFSASPMIKGLWVRVKFFDNESLEGVIRNSIEHLVRPGFFLKPPDPNSNNEILYVVKKSLIDFCVLGVRTDY